MALIEDAPGVIPSARPADESVATEGVADAQDTTFVRF